MVWCASERVMSDGSDVYILRENQSRCVTVALALDDLDADNE